ncbi:hypothetical protein [Actinosynnema sp. NPDC020468]|uniref:hypothetical protein n=1 Tax=Actinosynnema sp. NPDC020468 TaxID=3154488 RepID=UPI0033FB1AF7
MRVLPMAIRPVIALVVVALPVVMLPAVTLPAVEEQQRLRGRGKPLAEVAGNRGAFVCRLRP